MVTKKEVQLYTFFSRVSARYLFHWAMNLFYFQDHTVLILLALYFKVRWNDFSRFLHFAQAIWGLCCHRKVFFSFCEMYHWYFDKDDKSHWRIWTLQPSWLFKSMSMAVWPLSYILFNFFLSMIYTLHCRELFG